MPDTAVLTLDSQLQNMLRATKDGRYAVRLGDRQPWKFFRITRPKNGRFEGAIKIQSQHSEVYAMVCALYANGKIQKWDRNPDLITHLRLLVCDPTTAMIDYGREMECCGRCGKQLTDARSRHYGIGPECEKHIPEVIAMAIASKGAFNPALHS